MQFYCSQTQKPLSPPLLHTSKFSSKVALASCEDFENNDLVRLLQFLRKNLASASKWRVVIFTPNDVFTYNAKLWWLKFFPFPVAKSSPLDTPLRLCWSTTALLTMSKSKLVIFFSVATMITMEAYIRFSNLQKSPNPITKIDPK